MNNWELFFMFVGVCSVSWNICKFIFWIDGTGANK